MSITGPYFAANLRDGTIALCVALLFLAACYHADHYDSPMKAWIERLVAQWQYRRLKKHEAAQYAEYNRVRREQLMASSRKLQRLK